MHSAEAGYLCPEASAMRHALRPMSAAASSAKDTVLAVDADVFFKSMCNRGGKDGIPVLRNNVSRKNQGQVTMRVCEISELSDEERPGVIEALDHWSDYAQRVTHQWRVDEIIADLKRAESGKEVPLNGDLRRTYIAISSPEVNGKEKVDVEGFVIVKEFDGDTWVACWEIKPDNRDEEPRFIGIGRQLLCYAVHRELGTRYEIGFDLDTEDELRAEGLRPNIIYEDTYLVDYVRRRIRKTLKILEDAPDTDIHAKALLILLRATQVKTDASDPVIDSIVHTAIASAA